MPAVAPLRSLLLVWVGIVYLWGLEALNRLMLPLCVSSDQSCQFSITFSAFDAPRTGLFTVLLVLLAGAMGLSLAGRLARRALFVCVLAQVVLIFAVYLLAQQEPLTLSLALALALEIITLPQLSAWQVRLLSLGSYVLLSIGMIAAQRIIIGPGIKWLWIDVLQNVPVYLAELLFLSGYLLLYRQLARSHRRLRAAAEQIEELTRLTERQRLARDLHDTLAQGLVGMIMQLEVANAHLLRDRVERGQELVQGALEGARATLIEARQAIDDLRTEGSAGGLARRIQEEVLHFTSTTGIICQTSLADLTVMPSAFCEPVVRLVKEGLQNIARHADARRVWIEARRERERYSFVVRDDGRGFEPETLRHMSGHYGLLGLREQAELVGGRLEIQSVPGQGTTLRLCLANKGRTHDRQTAAHPGS